MTNNLGDSLSGAEQRQNCRGVGSSPALPTKKLPLGRRIKLHKRLRELDRRYTILLRQTRWASLFERANCHPDSRKNLEMMRRIDLKRKQVRWQLKGYNV